MNILCPASHYMTIAEYRRNISLAEGEVLAVNTISNCKLNDSSVVELCHQLQTVITTIQELKANITLELEELNQSNFFCCVVNNSKCISICTSILETGLITTGGILAYHEGETSATILGITCMILGQVLSKANDLLADRSEQMRKREDALKERLFKCELLEDTANDAKERLWAANNSNTDEIQMILQNKVAGMKNITLPNFSITHRNSVTSINQNASDPSLHGLSMV